MERLSLGSFATVCGVILLAVCIYFDHIRHKDPNFRAKLKKRRENVKKQTEDEDKPDEQLALHKDTDDSRRQQAQILTEIQMAEEMMSQKKIETAVYHFAKAISLCSDPDNIITSLEETLPPMAYDMLLTVLINCYGERFDNLKSQLNDRCKASPTINFLQLKL